MITFDSNLMLLTGAGASIPVGIPGMAGMVRDFKASHGRGEPARRAYETLMRVGVPDDLEEVLQFCNRLIELREPQVTNVLEDAAGPRAGASVREFRRRLGDQIETAELLRDSLIGWIGDICLQFDRGKATAIYGDLVKLLASRKIPVFTTNYDGVLDEVATAKHLAIADNFVTDERGRSFWDSKHESFFGSGLRIVKLHGSIYWHASSSSGVIEKMLQPARRNAEGDLVSQLLIFPTRFKDIYQQDYFPLYGAFTRTLARATTLVLIGHSLRDEYLLAAIRERLKDKSFGLLVVDVELPRAIQDWKERILHLDGGVETLTPLLCEALTARRTKEKLFGYLRNAQSAIKRRRKEKVRVAGAPKYAVPGQVLDKVVLSLGTVVGAYTWEAFISVDNEWVPLSAGARSKSVRGFGTKTVPLKLKLPKNLVPGQSYQLSFTLFDEHGNEAASADRTIRMKRL